MKIKSNNKKLVDYVFWVTFILFSNPGGIFAAFGEDTGDGGINVSDFIFVILFVCYIFVLYKTDIGYNKTYNKIVSYIIVITLYHFLVFNFFVPVFKENVSSSVLSVLIKSRHEVYSILLFFMVYRFFIRNYKIFFVLLFYSTIIILSLFITTVLTGIEILPVAKINRGFVNIDRIFLSVYGFMPLLIPIGAVVIALQIRIKWRKIILVAFGLMFLTLLLSLTRRDIFGTIVYLVIALMLNNYFLNKTLIPFSRVFSLIFYSLIIGFFIHLSFPKYIDAGVKTVEETIFVMNHGETTQGRKDTRLGLGKEFMQNLIKDNIIWGTGYDKKWRGGSDQQGYEASDYPFLSAIAMKGIIGVIIFLPIYIILIKTIRFDLKFIKINKIGFNNTNFFIIILFILYFIFDLMQYMNWFKTVSRMKDYEWFVYLAMYLASRQIFYSNLTPKRTLV